MRKRFSVFAIMVLASAMIFAGCARKQVKTEAVAEEPTIAAELEEAGVPEPVEEPVEAAAPREAPAAPMELKAVYFDFDRHSVRTDAVPAIRNNADLMKADGDAKIVIEGHCDERGTDEYNMALGERRARAVKDYLATLGVDSSRIQVISYGNEKPFCTRHTEQCWQENRRAHFRRVD